MTFHSVNSIFLFVHADERIYVNLDNINNFKIQHSAPAVDMIRCVVVELPMKIHKLRHHVQNTMTFIDKPL